MIWLTLIAALLAPPPRPPGWLKGQLHAHSDQSAGSKTPPLVVGMWYRDHGFDFLVYTDHNRVHVPPRVPGILLLPGVEITLDPPSCTPPPEADHGCSIHVNALVVKPARLRLDKVDEPAPLRVDVYRRGLKQAVALGGVGQLNHPNFRFMADGQTLIDLAADGPLLFEVANEAVDSMNQGNATHPSTEAMWDQALTAGRVVYGTATDDAHDYLDAPFVAAQGEMAHVGNRGFVMVKARRNGAAIRKALATGRFYASNGPFLEVAEVKRGALRVEGSTITRIRFIGTGGEVLSTVEGSKGRHVVPKTGYVRAVAEDLAGRKAWVQPVWRR
jgi:hypothetical protein